MWGSGAVNEANICHTWGLWRARYGRLYLWGGSRCSMSDLFLWRVCNRNWLCVRASALWAWRGDFIVDGAWYCEWHVSDIRASQLGWSECDNLLEVSDVVTILLRLPNGCNMHFREFGYVVRSLWLAFDLHFPDFWGPIAVFQLRVIVFPGSWTAVALFISSMKCSCLPPLLFPLLVKVRVGGQGPHFWTTGELNDENFLKVLVFSWMNEDDMWRLD